MKKGTGRTVLIILIISFIVQIIPNVIYINKKFPFHPHNQLIPKNLYISNHVINRRNENYSNPKNSILVSTLNNNIVMFTSYCITKQLQYNKPFDHRKSIRQTIPNYFHGSNNKHSSI